MAQFEFVDWLLLWLLESLKFEFEWDLGNRTKNEGKHGVFTNEIEEVFHLRMAMPLGVQISPAHPEERLGIVGATNSGRVLMIAFTLREGKVRPISARSASSKERKTY